MASKTLLNLFCFLSLLLAGSAYGQLPKEVLVIGNDIGKSSMSKKQLVEYMKGERNFWLNGNKVELALPSNKSEIVDIVASSIYKTSSIGMQKYWLAMVFQGRSLTPSFFNTDEEVIAFVKKYKGAIGFIQVKNKNQASDFVIDVLPN